MDAARDTAERSPQVIELPHRMSIKDPFMYQLGIVLKPELENGRPYGNLLAETVANMIAVHLLRNFAQYPSA
jgi:AraC family transcriptional regulator